METKMASRISSTRCQTSPPRHVATPISILVVIVVIVALHPTPALVTACASLALATGATARRIAEAYGRPE